MCGKATLAACEWIQQQYPGRPEYILSGNVDTDKKHSQINMIATRGRRFVAEAVVKKDLLKSLMGVDSETLFWARQISNAGAFLVGAANNGAHAANGLTAMFIATGHDVANVSESHAGVAYTQLLPNGDYYWSITLPALIVATYGGGTGLASQRECLDMLGCYGSGNVKKFAEICAAVVLAGEIPHCPAPSSPATGSPATTNSAATDPGPNSPGVIDRDRAARREVHGDRHHGTVTARGTAAGMAEHALHRLVGCRLDGDEPLDPRSRARSRSRLNSAVATPHHPAIRRRRRMPPQPKSRPVAAGRSGRRRRSRRRPQRRALHGARDPHR